MKLLPLLYSYRLMEIRIWMSCVHLIVKPHLLVLQGDFNYAVREPTYIYGRSSAGKQQAFSRLLQHITYNDQVGLNKGNSLWINTYKCHLSTKEVASRSATCFTVPKRTIKNRDLKKKKKGGGKGLSNCNPLFWQNRGPNCSAEKPGTASRRNPSFW